MDNFTKIHTELNKHNCNIVQSNYALFAYDTSIDISNFTHMKPLLGTYNDSDKEYSLTIQWAKDMILTKQKFVNKFQNRIQTLPHPYNLIQCVTKS